MPHKYGLFFHGLVLIIITSVCLLQPTAVTAQSYRVLIESPVLSPPLHRVRVQFDETRFPEKDLATDKNRFGTNFFLVHFFGASGQIPMMVEDFYFEPLAGFANAQTWQLTLRLRTPNGINFKLVGQSRSQNGIIFEVFDPTGSALRLGRPTAARPITPSLTAVQAMQNSIINGGGSAGASSTIGGLNSATSMPPVVSTPVIIATNGGSASAGRLGTPPSPRRDKSTPSFAQTRGTIRTQNYFFDDNVQITDRDDEPPYLFLKERVAHLFPDFFESEFPLFQIHALADSLDQARVEEFKKYKLALPGEIPRYLTAEDFIRILVRPQKGAPNPLKEPALEVRFRIDRKYLTSLHSSRSYVESAMVLHLAKATCEEVLMDAVQKNIPDYLGRPVQYTNAWHGLRGGMQ